METDVSDTGHTRRRSGLIQFGETGATDIGGWVSPPLAMLHILTVEDDPLVLDVLCETNGVGVPCQPR